MEVGWSGRQAGVGDDNGWLEGTAGAIGQLLEQILHFDRSHLGHRVVIYTSLPTETRCDPRSGLIWGTRVCTLWPRTKSTDLGMTTNPPL